MSAIESHGNVESTASETYGTGKTILRIGNGGAGATGLVAALANDYLSTLDCEASMSWVCNHSRNTQLALRSGYVDIALTYERSQEQISIDEGWAVSGGCVFHDHFSLVGPVDDPADVRHAASISDAFKRIANAKALFVSRADHSATMIKELAIWNSTELKPWLNDSDWYLQTLYSPAEAVQAASSKQAYLLTDRSTLLYQTMKGNLNSITAFIEPTSGDSILMNSCYALYDPHAQSEERKEVLRFLEYLLSQRGQNLITEYGHKDAGLPLFAAVAPGYARTSIVGGRPVNRHWLAEANTKL